jgi:hypothetical protein
VLVVRSTDGLQRPIEGGLRGRCVILIVPCVLQHFMCVEDESALKQPERIDWPLDTVVIFGVRANRGFNDQRYLVCIRLSTALACVATILRTRRGSHDVAECALGGMCVAITDVRRYDCATVTSATSRTLGCVSPFAATFASTPNQCAANTKGHSTLSTFVVAVPFILGSTSNGLGGAQGVTYGFTVRTNCVRVTHQTERRHCLSDVLPLYP